jgi:hypothetical protein
MTIREAGLDVAVREKRSPEGLASERQGTSGLPGAAPKAHCNGEEEGVVTQTQIGRPTAARESLPWLRLVRAASMSRLESPLEP